MAERRWYGADDFRNGDPVRLAAEVNAALDLERKRADEAEKERERIRLMLHERAAERDVIASERDTAEAALREAVGWLGEIVVQMDNETDIEHADWVGYWHRSHDLFRAFIDEHRKGQPLPAKQGTPAACPTCGSTFWAMREWLVKPGTKDGDAVGRVTACPDAFHDRTTPEETP